MEFKDKIKNARLKLNKTLEEVGRDCDVSKATVLRWESGEIKNIKRDKISKLAKSLNVSPSYLMDWEEKEEKREEDISFDDFRFALYGEVKDLSEEQKQDILDFARFIKNKNK